MLQMQESPQHFGLPPGQVPQLTVPPQPLGAEPQTWKASQACAGVIGVHPHVSGFPPPPQRLKPVHGELWVPPDPLQVVAVPGLPVQLTGVPADANANPQVLLTQVAVAQDGFAGCGHVEALTQPTQAPEALHT